jgi:hypothetical protein
MNQPVASELDPVSMSTANVALVEDAVKALESFHEEILMPRHSPSWGFSQVPDGLALCVSCWRLITVWQLGGEPCPGAERRASR